jgi:VWFA-related protein
MRPMRCAASETVLLLCLFGAPVQVFSQATTPPLTSATTLRTGVQLVVEDVVVTDKNGMPVHGLQQGDFTVLENKAPQTIKSFEEHSGETAKPIASATLPAGVFSNVPATKSRVVNVLLLDGLNTPPQSQPYLRNQLVKFLAEERPGTQTAVFTLNSRLGLLQDFTTDTEILKRAVKSQGVQFSPLLNHELNDEPAHKESEAMTDMILQMTDPTMIAMLENVQRNLLDMQARQASQQTQVRARMTMEALKQLARYLAGVPGRKNLLWFSGSFPVSIQRDVQTTGDPFAGQADLHEELKVTVDLLAKNQVAVYPIDARGLEVPPSQNPDHNNPPVGGARTQLTYGTRSATPTDDQFVTDQGNEHNTMRQLAEGTGGEAFYNTNDLAEATQRATTDGENYYTLLYTPPADAKPGEFRPVQVKVNKPGLQLAYRRGYYATVPGETAAQRKSALRETAGSDSPDASEIRLQLQPVLADAKSAAQAIGLAAVGSAEHHQYALNLLIPGDGIEFTSGGDGKQHATLEFATLIYDARGKVIDSHQDLAALALDPERYRTMQTGGLRFHHTVALPLAGKQTVRVLVHDVSTNRVGSLRLSADQIRQAAGSVSK